MHHTSWRFQLLMETIIQQEQTRGKYLFIIKTELHLLGVRHYQKEHVIGALGCL